MPEPTTVEQEIETSGLREGNISLILESYDDIFSDFDPRPYEHKALSDDFLTECRKAARDKDEFELELRLIVPKEKRDLKSEEHIRHRLHEHFHKHLKEKERELRNVKQKGALMLAFGVFCFAITVSISMAELTPLAMHILTFLFEPAGWFLMWTGLEQLFFASEERRPEYDFYRKMSNMHIGFYGY
jgi:hypothetical protein